jgi:hypothetical protein
MKYDPFPQWKVTYQSPSEDPRQKDLDETRRLLYMLLLVSRTEKYELAGTLVNALLHHSNLGVEPRGLIRTIIDAISGNEDDWIYDRIVEITEQLQEQEGEK